MKVLITAAAFAVLATAAHAAAPPAGKAVFDQWCSGCHAPMDARIGFAPPAGTYTLGERYKTTKPAALEQRTDLIPAYIKLMVRNGQGMMPQSRKTEISDAQLDDLAAYLAKTNR